MTRSMTRWTLAGCMALATLSAAAVLDFGAATAEAAPSVSRFAGTYVDASGVFPTTITISDGGRITSSYSFGSLTYSDWTEKGTISGRVIADGSYSYTQHLSGTFIDPDFGTRFHSNRSDTFAGNMAPDAVGNIVGSGGTGGSFVWVRQ